MVAARSVLSAQTQSAANHADHWLLTIWEQILHVQPVHWDKTFSEYGGDVVAAMQIITSIEKVLGRKIDAGLLSAEITPYDLFKSIQLSRSASAVRCEAGFDCSGGRVSPVDFRLERCRSCSCGER